MPPPSSEDDSSRLLVDHLPGGIIFLAGESIAFLNREALGLLGLENASTLVGTSVLDRVPPEYHAEVSDRIRRLNQNREPVGAVNLELIRGDASRIPIQVSAIPFRLQGQDGALVFVRDFPEEENFRILLEQLPAGVFVQTKGRFALANQEARRIFGVPPSETLVGQPVLDRFAESVRPRVAERIQRLNHGRQPVAKVEEAILRNGAEVPVQVSAVPFRFHGRDGALVFLRDTTDDQNLRTILDKLPAAVLVQVRGRIALLNQEAARLMGVSDPESVLGRPVLEMVPPQDRDRLMARVREMNQRRHPFERYEETLLQPDGTRVTVQASAFPFPFQGEEGVLVFMRDLTHEREAEHRIAVQDDLLRLTGSMAKVGGWEFDAATGKGSWTDEVAKIHDLDPSVPTEVGFGVQFYTPESRQQIEAAVAAAVDRGLPFDLVLELVSAKGVHKWVRTQGTPVVSGGKTVQVKGIFQDISEQWRNSRAREEERERLDVTLRSIGDGVITTDTEGRVVLMSRSAEDLTGWSQAEAQGRVLEEIMPLVHEWTRRPLENPVQTVLREGRTVELASHTVLLARDGRERLIADSAAPIRDRDDRIQGVVLVFRDMTEKQKLTEAVQRAQNLESIGLLAAGIAHDFNNLLSGLFGQIQLAEDKVRHGRTEEAAVNFERALGVFDRARDLTGQLLTFSKGGTPVRVPLDLGPLIRKTVQFALAGSNVGVQFDLASDLKPVLGDPNQLAQAIDNLVINARQAMPAGGTVGVSAENRTSPEGRSVVITIRDQGPGIPQETLTRIFDPFFTTKAGGHGLGLAAVLSIVQRHEGRVEAESPPGGGAVFRIFLPA